MSIAHLVPKASQAGDDARKPTEYLLERFRDVSPTGLEIQELLDPLVQLHKVAIVWWRVLRRESLFDLGQHSFKEGARVGDGAIEIVFGELSITLPNLLIDEELVYFSRGLRRIFESDGSAGKGAHGEKLPVWSDLKPVEPEVIVKVEHRLFAWFPELKPLTGVKNCADQSWKVIGAID